MIVNFPVFSLKSIYSINMAFSVEASESNNKQK